MARYFLQLSYKGTDFHGWQVQPNAISIQETLEDTIKLLTQTSIKIIGCGRTDTGVHASLFYAHFDIDNLKMPIDKLQFKMNSILPKTIAIHRIIQVADHNHARFDATSRTYKYYISKQKDPFKYDLSFQYTLDLNISLMNEAARLLLDYEDFTSFSKLHTDAKTNLCKVKAAYWEETENELIFTITANRFLRNMVRAVVGTLLNIGKEKQTIQEFKQIIEARDRNKAGSSAPAEGLFLHNITYPYIKAIKK